MQEAGLGWHTGKEKGNTYKALTLARSNCKLRKLIKSSRETTWIKIKVFQLWFFSICLKA